MKHGERVIMPMNPICK